MLIYMLKWMANWTSDVPYRIVVRHCSLLAIYFHAWNTRSLDRHTVTSGLSLAAGPALVGLILVSVVVWCGRSHGSAASISIVSIAEDVPETPADHPVVLVLAAPFDRQVVVQSGLG